MRNKSEKRKQHHLCTLLIVTVLIFSGCEPPRLSQPRHIEQRSLDLSPLQGRIIVVDPGHGGRFSGAIGIRGLRESDVNLAVGLHLWGLLKQAGAEAWLTRTADVDLVPDAAGSLKDDLSARARLSKEVNADLFVSIHHNSNTEDRKQNTLQVYYKLADPGPSQDLARCVAQELANGLSPEEIFVLPGNYRVLRETEATAILGEASFLSHGKNEERLALSNQLRREAESYFSGILTYFQKASPEAVELHPDGETLEVAFPPVGARLIGGHGGKAIDPATVSVFLDGGTVLSTFDPQSGILTHIPQSPLTNGPHAFSVAARNFNGNAIRPNRACFRIALPPGQINVSSSFALLPLGDDASSRIEVQALDDHGNPVADGTALSVTASGGRLDRSITFTAGGKGVAYFFPPSHSGEIEVVVSSSRVSGTTRITCGSVPNSLLRLSITDQDHAPLGGVHVTGKGSIMDITDENGLAFLHTQRVGEIPVTLSRPGYLTAETALMFEKGTFQTAQRVLKLRAGGAFLEQTITIDPEPWDNRFADEYGLKPDAEGSNIGVALKLQALLEAAGAKAVLTRRSLEESPTLENRIGAGEVSESTVYITLTHRKRKPSVGHYFNSAAGKQLAQHLAASIKETCGMKEVTVQNASEFTIIHPSCPSVVVNFGSLSKSADDEAWGREAQGVYQGLLNFFCRYVKERSGMTLQ